MESLEKFQLCRYEFLKRGPCIILYGSRALVMTKSILGVSDKVRLKPVSSAIETI